MAASKNHGEYVPGTMDITEQEKTFEGFIRMVTRGVILVLVVLVFLALANA